MAVSALFFIVVLLEKKGDCFSSSTWSCAPGINLMALIFRVMQEVGRYSTIDMAVDFLTVRGVREPSSFWCDAVWNSLGRALLIQFAAAPRADYTPSTRSVTTGHALCFSRMQ